MRPKLNQFASFSSRWNSKQFMNRLISIACVNARIQMGFGCWYASCPNALSWTMFTKHTYNDTLTDTVKDTYTHRFDMYFWAERTRLNERWKAKYIIRKQKEKEEEEEEERTKYNVNTNEHINGNGNKRPQKLINKAINSMRLCLYSPIW